MQPLLQNKRAPSAGSEKKSTHLRSPPSWKNIAIGSVGSLWLGSEIVSCASETTLSLNTTRRNESPFFDVCVYNAQQSIPSDIRGFLYRNNVSISVGETTFEAMSYPTRYRVPDVYDTRIAMDQIPAVYMPGSNTIVVSEYFYPEVEFPNGTQPLTDIASVEKAVIENFPDLAEENTSGPNWIALSPALTEEAVLHEAAHGLFDEAELTKSASYEASYDLDLQEIGGQEKALERGYQYYLGDEGDVRGREEVFAKSFSILTKKEPISDDDLAFLNDFSHSATYVYKLIENFRIYKPASINPLLQQSIEIDTTETIDFAEIQNASLAAPLNQTSATQAFIAPANDTAVPPVANATDASGADSFWDQLWDFLEHKIGLTFASSDHAFCPMSARAIVLSASVGLIYMKDNEGFVGTHRQYLKSKICDPVKAALSATSKTAARATQMLREAKTAAHTFERRPSVPYFQGAGEAKAKGLRGSARTGRTFFPRLDSSACPR
ncbi:MAG: hypothetical protein PHE27_04840 [Alphaproteobacteria bacterium]|nr:hypothetical protein [Alphaproteobacteria bacterium]